MAHPLVSRHRAQILSATLFAIALGIVALFQAWWPGIMLATGFPLALRQFLLGRRYDMGITLAVFIGTFITVAFPIDWEVLLPALLLMASFYLAVREWQEGQIEDEEEKEEEIVRSLEEDHQ
jgi:hypothetical protein